MKDSSFQTLREFYYGIRNIIEPILIPVFLGLTMLEIPKIAPMGVVFLSIYIVYFILSVLVSAEEIKREKEVKE